MATPQLCPIRRQTCEELEDSQLVHIAPLYETEKAAESRVHGTAQAATKAAATQNPFAFYDTHLGTNVPLLGDQFDIESDDDDYTNHSGGVPAHSTSVDDAQLQAKGHTTAYKLAVRLANRSNGVPLATIIEQGSYSTLNSHASLLSVARFPSIKATESGSPNRGSRRRSRSLDEKALHDIQEDLTRENDTSAVAVSPAKLDEDHAAADPPSDTATPLTSYRFETQLSLSTHSGEERVDQDDQGVRRFFRGVMQTVRGVSKTRSRSSSAIRAPIMQAQGSPISTCTSRNSLLEQVQDPVQRQKSSPSASTRAFEGHIVSPNSEDQTRDRTISFSEDHISARMGPPLVPFRSDVCSSPADINLLPPALPCRNAKHTHVPLSLAPVEHAGTRDVARDDGTAQAITSHSSAFDHSARYTFDTLPVYRQRQSSAKEAKDARDVFASHNASFCSTVSTSYSSKVLGIDLDLEHDVSHSIRRSQSPPPPVWFTPQMAELERQASYSDSPESAKARGPTGPFCRSITSSALTSLLPIAAASGIVQPNYNTPKISFYSPSGNLIQPESSSPLATSPSEYGGCPLITTSHYNRHNGCVKESAGGLPVRPPLVPMTTPPIHKHSLPLHLRHHHNYQQPELFQTISRSTLVTTDRLIKGCDGVVRESSFTPRSGTLPPPGEGRGHYSAKLAMRDVNSEVKFYKSRLLAFAAAHSFLPSMQKGKPLQTQRVHDYNTYAKNPYTVKPSDSKGVYRKDVLGPVAAHALRVCFCQPHDGAGTWTRATAVGTCMAGSQSPDGISGVDRDAKDVERLLPNARVVGSQGGVDSRSQSRTDSMVSNSPRRASYTGTGKRKVG
ncbi:hypothetical protein E8E13_005368 [Curvularia kusanoi]|uniref:Uncharacterized protein n=1 Tax=Curvularia kusanoi TaxID=90978 RepID=A0A9P4TJU2_CURKU|nr:hypothetical protein E8E13_005368 [Curvularia kusanoi]